MKIQLINSQVSFFFNTGPELVYEKLSLQIREKTKISFVNPPTLLPLPPDAPPDIPRLIMQSVDNLTKIQLSGNKCELIKTHKTIIDDFKIDNTLTILSKDLIDVLHESDLVINRIGVVVKYFIETSEPTRLITNSITKYNADDISEITVRINKKENIKRFSTNSIYQYDQGIRQPEQQHGVLLTRDINTIHSEKSMFTQEESLDFVDTCVTHLNKENPVGDLDNE